MNKFLALCLTVLVSCGSKLKDYKTMAPFDGEKFNNLEPFDDKSVFDLLSWKIGSLTHSKDWPSEVDSKQYLITTQRSLKPIITVINHASVLIQMDNINILTDPHYSQRASPVSFAGPKRIVKPGIAFDNLPKIDVVLISHNHYDHLDLPTLKRLHERDKPIILAGLKTKRFLQENNLTKAYDLDWWQSTRVNNTEITFTPAQHWSARGLFDKREMLWGGFYIKGRNSIYFAGDTGYGNFFKLIEKKLSPPDIALIPIGAYEPRWFMKDAHLNPSDSLEAFKDLKAITMIGIHFGTFKLTDEGYKDPIKRLQSEIEKKKMENEDIIIPTFGKAYRF